MAVDKSYWSYKEIIPINLEEKQKLIDYEIWMFRETCRKIVCLGFDSNQVERNLLLESLAIHTRLLINFFYGARKNENDIIAVDFLSDWVILRPELTQILYNAKEKANKQLAHLSRWRIKLERDGKKPWDYIEIWGDMEKVIKKFMENKKILAKFWEGNKYESNLTLSVKLNEQNPGGDGIIKKIKSIQDIAINSLKNVLFFSDPYGLKNKGGLFIYPEDRFHFSLVNFLKCSCDFDIFFNNRNNDQYTKIREEIIPIINKHLRDSTLNICFKIKSLYIGGDKIDSISLQVHPLNNDNFIKIIKGIEKEAKEKLDENKIKTISGCEKDVKIKLWNIENPEECYAVINILRFMRSDNNIELIEEINLGDLVNKIKNEIDKNDLVFSINKLCLVESDPFLFKWNKVEDF